MKVEEREVTFYAGPKHGITESVVVVEIDGITTALGGGEGIVGTYTVISDMAFYDGTIMEFPLGENDARGS
jgi:hypothetical protein